MKTTLRVGLVGAGTFAGYHAGKVAAHDRAVLTGVYDPDGGRADALAQHNEVDAIVTLEALVDRSDAIIVASPATTHAKAALVGLKGGCHVLVEKPLAVDLDQARTILAAQGDRVIQVGHQERLVAEAIGLNDVTERPVQIEIIRHSGRSTRNLDVSVVMDLMIHDLDLLHSLYGRPDWISTEAARRIYSSHLDAVRAEIGYDGLTAYVSASRDAEMERRWRLRYPSGSVEIDFASKTLRNGTAHRLNETFGTLPSVQDSLAAAFDRFVSACLDDAPPLATGQEGYEALKMACAIEGDGL